MPKARRVKPPSLNLELPASSWLAFGHLARSFSKSISVLATCFDGSGERVSTGSRAAVDGGGGGGGADLD